MVFNAFMGGVVQQGFKVCYGNVDREGWPTLLKTPRKTLKLCERHSGRQQSTVQLRTVVIILVRVQCR